MVLAADPTKEVFDCAQKWHGKWQKMQKTQKTNLDKMGGVI